MRTGSQSRSITVREEQRISAVETNGQIVPVRLTVSEMAKGNLRLYDVQPLGHIKKLTAQAAGLKIRTRSNNQLMAVKVGDLLPGVNKQSDGNFSAEFSTQNIPRAQPASKIGEVGVFWRKGEPPKSGFSKNYREGTHEAGVSVYPYAEETSFAGLEKDAPWYKIDGELVGYGSDGEPVVKVLKSKKATKAEIATAKPPSENFDVKKQWCLGRFS